MIDNAFRSALPRFSAPLIHFYGRLGLTPNGVTAIGFALATGAAACVVAGWNLAAVAVWWLGRLADGTDGIYARASGRTSGFGAYLDIVLDMAAYGLMIVAFDIVHPELHIQWIAILFFYVLCIASALALGMQEAERELVRRDDRGLRLGAGLAEGGETGLAYTLFLLLPDQLAWSTTLWIAVLGVTVVARTLLARRTLAD
ncbi:MAG: CDP-alcohol phosphatidyltransferase family protein [Myxococcota bacterium]